MKESPTLTITNQKSKMRRFLRIPFTFLYIFTFLLIYTTMTLLEVTNSKRAILTSVTKTIDNLNLTLGLQVSANNSLVSSEIVVDYLDGQSGLESAIRAVLSAKVAQSQYLRANTIIALDSSIPTLSSYQISTFPSSAAFLDLLDIKAFLINESHSFFFLRHEVIPSSYDLVFYPPERGLCSLVEKIYRADRIVGLLVSDYYTERLYDDGFAFSFPHGMKAKNVRLQNHHNVLKINADNPGFMSGIKDEIYEQKLFQDVKIVRNLNHERILVPDLKIIVIINVNQLLIRNILTFIILGATTLVLILTSNMFIAYTSNQIFDPLVKINDDIKKFLE